jgi:hypothetical protein
MFLSAGRKDGRSDGWRGGRSRLIAPALIGLLSGPVAAVAQEKVTFDDHIRPIFESVCNNCHNPDKKKGGLDLTSFAAAMAGGSSGEVVAAGAPGDSRLFASVTRAAEPFMPPQGDPLSAAQIELLKKWIEGGLLDRAGGVARKAKKPAFSAQLASVTVGRPDGPPPMPQHLLLEPVVVTRRAPATEALAGSPWAPIVALGGQKQVLLYNTDTLELAGVIPFPEGTIQSLTFSRNGKLVVAGTGHAGKNGKVVAWEVESGRRVFEIGEERDTVMAADLSADQAVVALGSPSKRVKLFRTSTGEQIKEIKKHTDWVTAVQFSPDGVLLATGDRAGNLCVWEGRTGNDFFTLPGHTAAITAVSWRADGNLLASASEDGTIRLWEMNEGKEVKKWNAHGGGVRSVNFTHDGRLVSCGRDNHAKVWNQDGAEQAKRDGFSDLTLAACFTHDGKRFVVGDWSGRISVWDAADAKAVGDLSAAPPSIDQRLASLKPDLEKTTRAVAAAKAALGQTSTTLATARRQLEQAQQAVAVFQQKTGSLEHALAGARTAAEALLTRLQAPVPAPAPTAPAMDLGTARLLAEDLKSLTTNAKAALGPMGSSVTEAGRDFGAHVPGQLSAQLTLAKAKQAELAEGEKRAAGEQQAIEQAAAALAERQKVAARWEAAKLNARIFHQRAELAAITTRIEELTEDVALRDKAIADLPARIAAATDADKPALEKSLAEAQSGLAGLRDQLEKATAEAAALRDAIERENEKYLSMLPE